MKKKLEQKQFMGYKWIVLSNTTIGTLMASLDTNIIIVILPVITSELHTSLLTTLWTARGYWLVLLLFY
jgi:hypothetical protein